MLIIICIFFCCLVFFGVFLYFIKTTPKKKNTVETANIEIEVENKQLHRTRAIEENEVIREAESHFRSLILKNPYSPLPFKVLAEFYIKNGLPNEAIKKCEKMITYLNKDLDLQKTEQLVNFLNENNRADLAEKIISFYSKENK